MTIRQIIARVILSIFGLVFLAFTANFIRQILGDPVCREMVKWVVIIITIAYALFWAGHNL